MTLFCPDEPSMRRFAAEVCSDLKRGDVVLLSGELGAGKTTFVRGYLQSLGVEEPVRSPTFNLLQVFDTDPPVLHADLYRVKCAEGIGLEDYLDSHLCMIEWPDRLQGFLDPNRCWQVHIDFEAEGRSVTVTPPVPHP